MAKKAKKAAKAKKPARKRRSTRRGKLTDRERRFIKEYLVDLNATQAAIRAGYSVKSARDIGYENLTKPDIQAAVTAELEALLNRAAMSAEEVLATATNVARSDIGKVFDDHGNLLDIKQLPDDIRLALSSVEVVEKSVGKGEVEYTRKIRLWDKIAALNLLAKYHKLLTDKIDLVAKVEELTAEDAAKMSDAELAATARKLAARAEALAAAASSTS